MANTSYTYIVFPANYPLASEERSIAQIFMDGQSSKVLFGRDAATDHLALAFETKPLLAAIERDKGLQALIDAWLKKGAKQCDDLLFIIDEEPAKSEETENIEPSISLRGNTAREAQHKHDVHDKAMAANEAIAQSRMEVDRRRRGFDLVEKASGCVIPLLATGMIAGTVYMGAKLYQAAEKLGDQNKVRQKQIMGDSPQPPKIQKEKDRRDKAQSNDAEKPAGPLR